MTPEDGRYAGAPQAPCVRAGDAPVGLVAASASARAAAYVSHQDDRYDDDCHDDDRDQGPASAAPGSEAGAALFSVVAGHDSVLADLEAGHVVLRD